MADLGPKIDFLQKEFAFGGRDPEFLKKKKPPSLFLNLSLNYHLKDQLCNINILTLHKSNDTTKTANVKK